MVIGYFNGRFQPLHNGHFKVMLDLLERCDTLWIGIANPLRELPKNMDNLDEELQISILKARAPEKNLYSFLERYQMIDFSLLYQKIDTSRFKIFPHFGFYDSENWGDFMPPKEESIIYIPAKDKHHFVKMEQYEKEGWTIEELPQIPGFSGEDFRREWPDGNWEDLVPIGTKLLLEEIHKA